MFSIRNWAQNGLRRLLETYVTFRFLNLAPDGAVVVPTNTVTGFPGYGPVLNVIENN